ncbi:DUF5334 family protein [Halomonas sp. V046]|uniref:DUF5334 family protein n=1 Tax=Halomonas sp. V046 TaxID=3459611 RepID=UPI004044BEA9
MRKLIAYLVVTTTLVLAGCAFAWDGYDKDSNSDITIESENPIRTGSEIEYYDWDSGEYRRAEVESTSSYGNTVELEIYDYDTGEYRIFEMEE